MKTDNDTRLFYQGEAVRTVVERDRHHTLIKNASLSLAELKVDRETRHLSLLASDTLNSVIGECNEDAHKVAYTPYGFQEGLASLIGFAGERRSALPAGYFLGNGYRFFNIALMRFNSPDNMSPFGGGGVNTYAYCAGDPVNRTDPSGHIYYVRSDPSKWSVYSLANMIPQRPDSPLGLASPPSVGIIKEPRRIFKTRLEVSGGKNSFTTRPVQNIAKKRPGEPFDRQAPKRLALEQDVSVLKPEVESAVRDRLNKERAFKEQFNENPDLRKAGHFYLDLRRNYETFSAHKKYYETYQRDEAHIKVQRYVTKSITNIEFDLSSRNSNVRR